MKSPNKDVASKTAKLKIIGFVILLLVLGIAIWWYATRFDRYRKKEMNNVSEALTAIKEDPSIESLFAVDFEWTEDLTEDPQFRDFVVGEVQELLDNDEIDLLRSFLEALEVDGQQHSFIRDTVTNAFLNARTLEEALKIKEELDSYLDYYNQELILTRDSQVLVSYIDEHGTNVITTEKGKGYYANKKDEKEFKRIGVANSPLYDAFEKIYFGDFEMIKTYGRKLDTYYQEKDYSDTGYFFRDNRISFSPDSGDCVWSGDYLFCFDSDGLLLGFCLVS